LGVAGQAARPGPDARKKLPEHRPPTRSAAFHCGTHYARMPAQGKLIHNRLRAGAMDRQLTDGRWCGLVRGWQTSPGLIFTGFRAGIPRQKAGNHVQGNNPFGISTEMLAAGSGGHL